ncbi:MAG TPA: thioredoxin family protein [Bacteroidia bacterium]|nr:thioredoxin family protein [Bacteroidia bacterium]
MIINLVEVSQLDRHLAAEDVVLADFYADWCEPCKWLDIILEKVDLSLSGNLSIVKIDIEKHQELSKKFRIQSVPVLVIFQKGEEKWRINGFLMEEELVKKIHEFSRET